jgi:hypothetical protein
MDCADTAWEFNDVVDCGLTDDDQMDERVRKVGEWWGQWFTDDGVGAE